MVKKPVFETRTEAVDATIGGIFGYPTDHNRRMVRGVTNYFVDGVSVSAEEFERLWKLHNPDAKPHR